MPTPSSLWTPPSELPSTGVDWLDAPLISDERDLEIFNERLQAAQRLREALCSVPFYAKRAEKARVEQGDEMAYWLDLQRAEPMLRRR